MKADFKMKLKEKFAVTGRAAQAKGDTDMMDRLTDLWCLYQDLCAYKRYEEDEVIEHVISEHLRRYYRKIRNEEAPW